MEVLGGIIALIILAVVVFLISESRAKAAMRKESVGFETRLTAAKEALTHIQTTGSLSKLDECFLLPDIVPLLETEGIDTGNWDYFLVSADNSYIHWKQELLPHNRRVLESLKEPLRARGLGTEKAESLLSDIDETFGSFRKLEDEFFATHKTTFLIGLPLLLKLRRKLDKAGLSLDEAKADLASRERAVRWMWGEDPSKTLRDVNSLEEYENFRSASKELVDRMHVTVANFRDWLTQAESSDITKTS